MRGFLLAAAFVGLGGAFGGGAEAAPFRLIVSEAETPLVPNSVMELAAQEGYFERAGVEVEFVRVAQSPMVMAALRSGGGEMANLSLEALLHAVGAGAQDLRAVMSPNKSLPYLIAGRGLEKPEDLAGKRFGIGRAGSVDHLLSLRVLEAQGVDPESLQLVALGQPQARAQAMLAGQIDATTMSVGVFSAIDETPGVSVLVDMEAYYRAAPILSKLNAVRLGVLESRRAEVEAVIEALTLAARDFQEDPALWVAAMKKARPDVPEADLEMLAQAFSGAWTVNGGLHPEELLEAQAWLHEGEDFKGIPRAPLESFADFAPLRAALSRIGPSAAGDAAGR